jgi:preprotein translocase subunit YajC
MTKFHLFLAQAPAQPAPAGPGMNLPMMLGYMILIGGMFWFMTAQQRKQKKQHAKMLAELKSGDDIITTGGIFGTITSVKEDRFVVRVGDNNQKLEIGKAFVQERVKKTEAAS